jgi:hypothetical protein
MKSETVRAIATALGLTLILVGNLAWIAGVVWVAAHIYKAVMQ